MCVLKSLGECVCTEVMCDWKSIYEENDNGNKGRRSTVWTVDNGKRMVWDKMTEIEMRRNTKKKEHTQGNLKEKKLAVRKREGGELRRRKL